MVIQVSFDDITPQETPNSKGLLELNNINSKVQKICRSICRTQFIKDITYLQENVNSNEETYVDDSLKY